MRVLQPKFEISTRLGLTTLKVHVSYHEIFQGWFLGPPETRRHQHKWKGPLG